MTHVSDNAIKTACRLGYAGLIPFVGCVILLGFGPIGLREIALKVLLTYGAIILGFMGAVHWGRAMFAMDASDPRDRLTAFVVSVVPALIGWFSGFLSPRPGLVVLAFAFASLYWYDSRVFKPQSSTDAGSSLADSHSWYLPLRLKLTCVVVFCLLVAVALL